MRRSWTRMPRSRSLAATYALTTVLSISMALSFVAPSVPAAAAPASPAEMKDWRSGFTDIAEKLAPSVVYITSEKLVEASAKMPDLKDFFPDFGPFGGPKVVPPQPDSRTASGSGFVVQSDGWIMTNNHVVAGADRVEVRLPDGRKFKGEVFTDQRTDLALVKIDATGLPAASFGDSDQVKVGQWAVAMGSPFGFRNTLTVGIVSALRREAEGPDETLIPYPESIQTDASINPGNSGGPLVDLDGNVIGINFMIFSQTGSNNGLGFAIPANTGKFVMEQLIEKGKVTRGYLGIVPQDLSPVTAEKLGATQGALITEVTKDSAADKAGMQVKDVVVEIDGKAVKDALSLRRIVERIPPGEAIKIVVVRDKAKKTLDVTLAEAPSGNEVTSPATGNAVGLSVQPLTEELAKQLGVDGALQGVVVRKVDPGSAAARAGVQVKDVILEIDDTPITSVATFSKALKDLKKGDTVIVVVQRGERSAILEMTID